MKIILETDVRAEEPVPHGRIGMSTAYRLTDQVPNRTMEFRRRTLHPDAAIGLHPIEHDEVYYILSGEGVVEADGETRHVTAGAMAYLYAGENVGIRQIGDDPLDVIVSYPVVPSARRP